MYKFIFLIGLILFFSYSLLFQSARLDETQSIWVSDKSVSAILNIMAQDVHPPLYFLMLHFWIKIFGLSIQSVRFLSFIIYLVSLYFLYKLGLEFGNKRLAILTLFLFALSPFVLWYSLEGRMYTLLTLAAILNHFYFLRFLNSEGKKGKLGFFLSSVLGVYTHYFFNLLIASQFFYLGFIAIKSGLKNYKNILLKYFLLQGLVYLIFSPWVFYVYKLGLAQKSQPQIPTPSSFNLFSAIVSFFIGFQPANLQGILVAFWPLLSLVLIFLFTKKRNLISQSFGYFLTVTFLPIILTFIVSLIFKPIFLTRYLIFVVPTLIFVFLTIILSYTRKQVALFLIGVLFIGTIFFLGYQNVSAQTPVKENYLGVTKFLNQNTKSDDLVMISSPFTIYPIEYYYSGKAKLITIPNWDRFVSGPIPRYSRQNLQKDMQNYQKNYQNVYLILSYDQGYESDIRNYFDHNFQLEKHITYSLGLEMREYKLRY